MRYACVGTYRAPIIKGAADGARVVYDIRGISGAGKYPVGVA